MRLFFCPDTSQDAVFIVASDNPSWCVDNLIRAQSDSDDRRLRLAFTHQYVENVPRLKYDRFPGEDREKKRFCHVKQRSWSHQLA